MMIRIPIVVGAIFMAGSAGAVPVNLTGWIENGFQGNAGAGTWNVLVGNDAVRQTTNGDPTVFFNPGANSQGTSLAGTITPESSGDNDFVGFVLGYQDGELDSANADFWLIDWKQQSQNSGGQNGLIGLSLSHVTGDIRNGPNATNSFWSHTNTVTEVQRATTLGSTGWIDPQIYSFELTFTDTLIEVFVGGFLELSYSSTDHGSLFTDGAFGFYNYSQAPVLYAGITQDVLPPDPDPNPDPSVVPLPAGLPLLLAGLGSFAILRRKKSKV